MDTIKCAFAFVLTPRTVMYPRALILNPKPLHTDDDKAPTPYLYLGPRMDRTDLIEHAMTPRLCQLRVVAFRAEGVVWEGCACLVSVDRQTRVAS